MQHPTDLREHIAALVALGDLDRITSEVDWNLEAAAHTRYSIEHRLPAPLFEKITGVTDGFRILGAPAALSSAPGIPYARIALSVGLPPEATGRQIIEHLAATRQRPGIPPRTVDRARAEVKQNVLRGDDADLTRFPIPMVHEKDGGRYPGTYGVVVARTPDGSWTNYSITRVQMLDGKHMTGLMVVGQHLGLIWQQWVDLGKSMPYALVQGGDPVIPYVGGLALAAGVNEVDYAGALLRQQLKVVKAELSDLLVSANAEVVIEGHLSIGREALEGPFGEFSGYMPVDKGIEPVYSVEAITYRDDPIWPLVPAGKPVDETHTVSGLGEAAGVVDALRQEGLPVTTAWDPLMGAHHWLVVTVPSDWRNRLPGVSPEGFARRVGETIFVRYPTAGVSDERTPPYIFFNSAAAQVFLLDDDIDPSDEGEVLWAIATRVHPTAREVIFEDSVVMGLLTSYSPEERKAGRGPKVIHEALLPPPGEREVLGLGLNDFEHAYPAEVREKVLARHRDRRPKIG